VVVKADQEEIANSLNLAAVKNRSNSPETKPSLGYSAKTMIVKTIIDDILYSGDHLLGVIFLSPIFWNFEQLRTENKDVQYGLISIAILIDRTRAAVAGDYLRQRKVYYSRIWHLIMTEQLRCTVYFILIKNYLSLFLTKTL